MTAPPRTIESLDLTVGTTQRFFPINTRWFVGQYGHKSDGAGIRRMTGSYTLANRYRGACQPFTLPTRPSHGLRACVEIGTCISASRVNEKTSIQPNGLIRHPTPTVFDDMA